MYSPLDSGPKVYPENTVGDGREFLYLYGISATWHDVPSKDRRSDRRVTCQNSLMFSRNATIGRDSNRYRLYCFLTWIKLGNTKDSKTRKQMR